MIPIGCLMISKIKLKIGPVEVEYEGEETFFKEELPKIISEISSLIKATGIEKYSESVSKKEGQLFSNGTENSPLGTTSTIAAKLKVSSGSELALAAALRLMQNSTSFSRDQLISEMRSATTYFKNSYISNLSKSIDTLIKGQKLMEISKNVYAVSAATLEDMRNKLAN